MSELKSISLFDTILYQAHVPKYLEDKDFMAVCNENTDKAIKNTQQKIDKRNKKFKTDVKDHGLSYHSGAELYKDDRLYLKKKSKNGKGNLKNPKMG